MDKNIFKPLKMGNTHAYLVTDIRKIKNKNLAIGHIFMCFLIDQQDGSIIVDLFVWVFLATKPLIEVLPNHGLFIRLCGI